MHGAGSGSEIQWKCEADLPSSLRLGKVQVSCEGWDHADDPHILKGAAFRLVRPRQGIDIAGRFVWARIQPQTNGSRRIWEPVKRSRCVILPKAKSALMASASRQALLARFPGRCRLHSLPALPFDSRLLPPFSEPVPTRRWRWWGRRRRHDSSTRLWWRHLGRWAWRRSPSVHSPSWQALGRSRVDRVAPGVLDGCARQPRTRRSKLTLVKQARRPERRLPVYSAVLTLGPRCGTLTGHRSGQGRRVRARAGSEAGKEGQARSTGAKARRGTLTATTWAPSGRQRATAGLATDDRPQLSNPSPLLGLFASCIRLRQECHRTSRSTELGETRARRPTG